MTLTFTLDDEITVRQALTDASGATIDLTDATVTYRVRDLAESTLAVDAAATIEDPTTGGVSYTFTDEDLDEPGIYTTAWYVEFADGTDVTVAGETLNVRSALGDAPTLDDETLAWLRSKVGADEPPADADLATLYAALRHDRTAVAAAVLEGRWATIVSNPTKFSIDGEATFDYSDTLTHLETALSRLTPAGQRMPMGLLYRVDRER